jgi:hypothetical protein
MKYLKKWSLYLEDLKIEDSDTSDIKKAKEKLNTLRMQIDEFNSKYKDIDDAYKSNDDKKILDMEKKLFGSTDIRNGADRNEFLVKYLNIAKKKRQIDKGVNQIAIDDLNLRKSQDMVSITTDKGIKDQYNKEIPKIKQKIQNTKKDIEKKKVDASNSFQDIQREMLEREKEMLDYISKIQKDSNKEY